MSEQDLQRELTQARERDRIAAEAYNRQQTSYRELEALYQAMTERALAAEAERDNARRDAGDLWSVAAECMKILGQDAEAWRQAAERLERRCEQTNAINRELNVQVVQDAAARTSLAVCQRMLADEVALSKELVAIARAHHANYAAALDAGRQLLAVWRAERTDNERLRAALRTIRDNYGHVCRTFDTCSHVACRDSYSAWHVANDVLAELLNEG